MELSRWRAVLAGCAGVAVLSACASHTAFLPAGSSAQFGASPAASFALGDAAPAPCKGQKTTANFSSIRERLQTAGGALCIPSIGGYGGSILYPSAKPSVTLTLTSSTKNYTGNLPQLSKGHPMFYEQLAISGKTTFGSNVKAGGGLSGRQFVANKAYTVFAQATAVGVKVNLTPCYAVATKSPFGGLLGGLGTILKNQKVLIPATAVLEVYPGKSAKERC